MQQNPQLITYLSWVRDRGLVWPVARASHPELPREGHGALVCDICDRVFRQEPSLWMSGSPRPRLLFIGDKKDCDSPSSFFSEELDPMVMKMWQAMKLESDEFAVGQLVNCGSKDVDADHACAAANASSVLNFITELSPEAVIIFGRHTAALLCPDQDVFGQLKGLPQSPATKVISTYHPRELLENPMQKKATWGHLQSVMEMLGKQ